ncbi:MAG: hypothetical protein A2X00_10585 [Bacteroidetes bacterium GWE2_32_14]|nr:MAG: hypothetical protein A2X00_10585 [Bacteroidetes bacterium GWE2_32_14]
MNTDIAIIGMAGRFPDADNIKELYQNLKNGVDSIKPISPKRIKDTCLPPEKVYRVCGYMEDLDKFDYEIFDLSYNEAINMSPAQRLLLQTVYETLENSGYGLDYFNGSNTSVFAADTIATNYFEHADEFSPTLTTGNSREFLASKISRHFNLLGSSIVVNTACSASAVAIKLACNDLILGESDNAIVCGVNFELFPFKTDEDGFGVMSPSGKSMAFSSKSDGMSFGETSAAILLKPLDKAIQDKDIIHAIIKGSTVNNNGSRSSSILAPDSFLQADLMQKTWRKVGISPEDLGFIEAHGSGTDLGDCLEVEGLNLAIKKYTSEKKIIPISTIKSNIGHSMLCAGLVGVIKTVLSLKYKVLFPNINCEELNPKINFDQSPVYVNRKFQEWTVKNSKQRYAGVTSLGRSGVNSHIVLQEYISNYKIEKSHVKEDFLITISSRTATGLMKNIQSILNYIQNNELNIKDVCYTLNTGRRHYDHRYSEVIIDKEELEEKLNKYLLNSWNIEKGADKNFFFVFSDQVVSKTILECFSAKYPVFKEAMSLLKDHLSIHNAYSRSAIFQYSFYKFLFHHHISTNRIISAGLGRIVKSFIFDEITFDEFILGIKSYEKSSADEIHNKMNEFILKQSNKSIVFVDIGWESEISRMVKNYNSEIEIISFPDYDQNKDSNLVLEFIKTLYLNNFDSEWNKVFRNFQNGIKVELPNYNFEKVRCWLRDKPRNYVESSQETSKRDVSVSLIGGESDIEYLLATFFSQVLEKDTFSINDSFFDLGGDSLQATKVIQLINKNYNLNLDFEDLFDFPTIKEFSKYILEKIKSEGIIASIWETVLGKKNIKTNDSFFEIGGHSLIATQVINRIKQIFNIEINFDDIYDHSTLGELSNFVDNKISQSSIKSNKSGILISETKEYYPVSYSQKRMLFLEQMYKSGISYNNSMVFRLNGELNVNHLENIFNKLIKQHELFRTSFIYIDGVPFQRIHNNLELKIKYIDLSKYNDHNEKEELAEHTIKEFIKPFDLAEAPLFRVGLIQMSEKEWILIYDLNHIISDRATYDILVKDFILLYNNIELKTPKVQYKDFSLWEKSYFQSNEFLKKEKFWIDAFSEKIPELKLPIDFERPKIMNSNGDEYTFIIDEELTHELKELAKSKSVTIFVLLLAAFKVFIHKLTGQTDICIGSPYSLRNQVDVENMVGVLLNTIVFRSRPKADKSFTQFLLEVKNFSIQAYNNHEYPFEMLLEKINYQRSSDRNPIFDILFNSQTSNMLSSKDDQIKSMDLDFIPDRKAEKTSAFDLSLMIEFSGSIVHFIVHYRTSLFEHSTIKNFMEEYKLLLVQIADDPNKLLTDYDLFKDIKREKLRISNKLN